MPTRPETIPYGYCHCGCGETTALATRDHAGRGWVKGHPYKFRKGHYVYPSLEEQLWRRVQRGLVDDCWPWMGGVVQGGYGHITHKGRHKLTHRAAYELLLGPIPDGWHVLHRCDNPPCCNPDHLFLGTDKDNTADKVAKGRQSRGESAGSAKLTEADVRAMRVAAAEGRSQSELAREYGVHTTVAHRAIHGRTWRHIT